MLSSSVGIFKNISYNKTDKTWNVLICNVYEATDKVAEVSKMTINRTEIQPNQRKQW